MTRDARDVLGHAFARPELLREALTHRSVAGRRRGFSNERLEFIGDRVLGLTVAEWLAERFPDAQEGELGIRLAQLVSQPVLANIAEAIGLDGLLSVAPGEAKAGVKRRATVLSDALEAAIGAIYLDSGLDPARDFIRRAWADAIARQTVPPKDAKSALQEWFHARGRAVPAYEVVSREGPSHAPRFVVRVSGDNKTGTGTAGSKRVAEQEAAADLLEQLK